MPAKKKQHASAKRRVSDSKANGKNAKAISQLRCIIDPHTNISVYDMGLISELMVGLDSVSLTFRPTSPFCPLAMQLAMNIKRSMHDLDGVKKVRVTVVGHYQEDNINKALEQ